MSNREYRCGCSSEVYSPALRGPARKEPEAVRLVTRLHVAVPGEERTRYRAVGVKANGREGLICLAETHADAATRAAKEMGRFTTIRVERWVGAEGSGRWATVSVRHARWRRRFARNGRVRRTNPEE